MAYDSFCEEDLNLRFLLEDIPEDRDEVDSVSKHVIDFESRPVLSKYFIDSESRAVKQEATRLRTISEKIIKQFHHNISHHEDSVLALLRFKHELSDKQAKKLPSVLRDLCNNIVVMYHSSNLALLHMEAKSYTLLGEKIVEKNGLNMEDMIVTHLEELSSVQLPSCFIELLTPMSNAESFQRDLSTVLVTFSSSFKYLRLREGAESDLKPTNPSTSITLLFSKLALRNADKLSAILSEHDSPYARHQRPDVVRVPFEQLFLLKNHPAPLLGLISGRNAPGVRITVMFSTKKDEMAEFYRVVTGKDPVCRCDQAETTYMIYPLATHLELELIYNSTIHADPLSNIGICVRIKDHEKLSAALRQPLTRIDTGHWETSDPVGNRIKLFAPFE